jgi:hypothetical protein
MRGVSGEDFMLHAPSVEGNNIMELTAAEKEEFIALTQDSYDPELWLEEDLPILRAIKREYEEEQARERSEVPPAQPPAETEDDDEGTGADPQWAADGA